MEQHLGPSSFSAPAPLLPCMSGRSVSQRLSPGCVERGRRAARIPAAVAHRLAESAGCVRRPGLPSEPVCKQATESAAVCGCRPGWGGWGSGEGAVLAGRGAPAAAVEWERGFEGWVCPRRLCQVEEHRAGLNRRDLNPCSFGMLHAG